MSFSIKKNQDEKKVFPIDKPGNDSEILVHVNGNFPSTFEFWNVLPKDFLNKSTFRVFKTISKMFKYFDENKINVGTSLTNFYKKKKEIQDEPPLEGMLIYRYRNIHIYILRVG